MRALPDSLVCIGLCAFAYVYVFPYQSGINNPNENVRLYMTAALVEEGRYEIDTLRQRWGWVNDAAVHEGHIYSVKAPGTSLLGVPAYAAYLAYATMTGASFDRTHALWACRIFASVLPTLLFLFAFHRFLERCGGPSATRDAVLFSVGLGSLLYGYGMLFVSHTLSAACAFSAFIVIARLEDSGARAAPRRKRLALAAGLLSAMVTWFEYPGLPCSVVLTGYALLVCLRGRGKHGVAEVGAFAAGGLLPALSMMHFQYKAFGSPFTPGHLMVETQAFRKIHEQGIYGAVGPSWESLHGLLIDAGAGLFPLTPVLLLAIPGFVVLLREPAERTRAAVAIVIVLSTILIISSMSHWRGGWTIGPRYLALCVPFLGWAALAALARFAERAPAQAAALAIGCLPPALAASGAVSAYYPHLPPELTRPLPQLLSVLIAHDFAPPNAGNLLSIHGSASMVPLLGCALLCLAQCLRSIDGARLRLLVSAGALAIATALALPLLSRPAQEPGVAKAVAFITRRWSPAGHDKPARLKAELTRSDVVGQRDLKRLSELYMQEGRVREARRAAAGKL